MPPSQQELKQQNREDLYEAGMSPDAVDGLIDIVPDFDSLRTLSPIETLEFLVDLNIEVNNYMRNQTQKDQDIYAKYSEKKAKEAEAQFQKQLDGLKK
ncbi:hypothetical protein GCK72_019886 [Caenorhabditis remanei]|uniref:Uncharacterized protein n=1 Tax=Caenorhabditis remanei TaxID=31234 RepID=A0A6A5GE24_CAERE|nr:hypothetical protein GCK72_019886 [Caenorhabditis remanei]KAF1753330.1 hypothetical protein GCK72_019886 [Caenorhabditis remanei]